MRRTRGGGGRLATGLLGVAVAAWACGGGPDAGASGDGDESGSTGRAAASLPVAEPTGAVDEALAARGEDAFTARGCVACHSVGGGRLVGPDLAGVTERRRFEWFYHMVTNPDSMLRNDSTARRMLAEYMTPMLDQGATPDEVRAFWEYLRREAAGAHGADGDEG